MNDFILIEDKLLKHYGFPETKAGRVKLRDFLAKNNIPKNTWDNWKGRKEITAQGISVLAKITGLTFEYLVGPPLVSSDAGKEEKEGRDKSAIKVSDAPTEDQGREVNKELREVDVGALNVRLQYLEKAINDLNQIFADLKADMANNCGTSSRPQSDQEEAVR